MTTEDPGFGGIELEISGFEDFRLIGRGGFGAVYEASQPKLNRQVAIKVLIVAGLDETTKRRFGREQQAMGALSAHPAIVTLHDSGYTENGLPYLVMELMTGGSIASQIASQGPLSLEDGVGIITRVSGAVQEAHNAGLLHRDIKPENILISGYGEAKLTDFGIAAMMEGTASTTTSITATVEHAAPEVLGGVAPSVEADVYSLGSTLFTLLVGRSPFRAETGASMLAVITQALTEPVPDLREMGIPEGIAAVVERSTQKDPADRFSSAVEFAAELDRSLAREDPPRSSAILAPTVEPAVPTTNLESGRQSTTETSLRQPASVSPPTVSPSDGGELAGGTRVLGRPPPSQPVAPEPNPAADGIVRLKLRGLTDSGIRRRIDDAIKRADTPAEVHVRVNRRLRRKTLRYIERAVVGAVAAGTVDRIQLTLMTDRQGRHLAKAAEKGGLRAKKIGGDGIRIESTNPPGDRAAPLPESTTADPKAVPEVDTEPVSESESGAEAEAEAESVGGGRRRLPVGVAVATLISAFVPWVPFRSGLTFSNFHESVSAFWGDSDVDVGSWPILSVGSVLVVLAGLALLGARTGRSVESFGSLRSLSTLVGLAMVSVAGLFILSWSFENQRLESGFYPPGEEGLVSGSVWLVFVGGVALLAERWFVRVPRAAWAVGGAGVVAVRSGLHLAGFEHGWYDLSVRCVWDRYCATFRSQDALGGGLLIGPAMLFLAILGVSLAWLLYKSTDRSPALRISLASLGATLVVITVAVGVWDFVNTREFTPVSLEFAIVRQVQLPSLVGLAGGGCILYGCFGQRRAGDQSTVT